MGDDGEARVDDEAEMQLPEEAEPQHRFSSDTMELVPDLRSICGLPANPDEDGLLTFRALVLPKGKTLHVPDEPGCYATVGPWRTQIALSLVHFVESTKRKAELLLAFADFGMLSNVAKGVFMMSLQLPLAKARNIFEETPRITTINDVSGFTSINVAEQPWATLLPKALERHTIFAKPQVFSPAAIIGHMKKPLAARLKVLADITRLAIADEVKDLARQDKRLAEKQKGLFEARLQRTMDKLNHLPPQKYDRRTEERILTVSADMTGADWLQTPQRAQLQAGTAEFRATSAAVRRLHHSPSPPKAAAPTPADAPVAAPAPAPAATPAPTPAAAPEDITSDLNLSEDEDDIPIARMASKRARNAPARLSNAAEEKKEKKAKASTPKVPLSHQSTPPPSPHPLPSPPLPSPSLYLPLPPSPHGV